MKIILYVLGVLALLIIVPIIVVAFNIFGARDALFNAISPIDFIEFDSDIEVRPDVDSHPLLDESQEATLESIGIDPADLPSEITPAMQECGLEALGAVRVQELLSGATPTFSDFINAQHCIE